MMDWDRHYQTRAPFEILGALIIAFSAARCTASETEDTKGKGEIYVVPMGRIEADVMRMLRDDLQKRFGMTCRIGKPARIPKDSYNKARKQYHSTAILRELKRLKDAPNDVVKILGVADEDLFVPDLNFVFGEAYVDGKCAVMSLTRLREEFYGKRRNDKLFKKRVLTEAVHELGHTFGLRHCKHTKCVMRFSNSLSDTDEKGSEFCKNCMKAMEGR